MCVAAAERWRLEGEATGQGRTEKKKERATCSFDSAFRSLKREFAINRILQCNNTGSDDFGFTDQFWFHGAASSIAQLQPSALSLSLG